MHIEVFSPTSELFISSSVLSENGEKGGPSISKILEHESVHCVDLLSMEQTAGDFISTEFLKKIESENEKFLKLFESLSRKIKRIVDGQIDGDGIYVMEVGLAFLKNSPETSFVYRDYSGLRKLIKETSQSGFEIYEKVLDDVKKGSATPDQQKFGLSLLQLGQYGLSNFLQCIKSIRLESNTFDFYSESIAYLNQMSENFLEAVNPGMAEYLKRNLEYILTRAEKMLATPVGEIKWTVLSPKFNNDPVAGTFESFCKLFGKEIGCAEGMLSDKQEVPSTVARPRAESPEQLAAKGRDGRTDL